MGPDANDNPSGRVPDEPDRRPPFRLDRFDHIDQSATSPLKSTFIAE